MRYLSSPDRAERLRRTRGSLDPRPTPDGRSAPELGSNPPAVLELCSDPLVRASVLVKRQLGAVAAPTSGRRSRLLLLELETCPGQDVLQPQDPVEPAPAVFGGGGPGCGEHRPGSRGH